MSEKEDQNIAILEQLEPIATESPNIADLPDITPIISDRPLTENQKKQIAFKALRETGLSVSKAGKLVGYGSNHVYNLEKKRKTGLISSLAPLAKKAVKQTLKGESTGNAEKPKTSDVLAASKMVLDRSDPVVQRIDSRSVSVHMEIKEDERERYLKALGLGG